MPGRNIIKQYLADHYYHVYSRGVAKQVIFHDEHDFLFFLSLFKRYLSKKAQISRRHGPYPHYGNRIRLVAFCLMPNHLHLLLLQKDERAITEFMRALMTSYSTYYNRRYKRVGPVFQSRYRASIIDKDNYFQHISRYIHINPKLWQNYPYSSLPYYKKNLRAEWIHPEVVLQDYRSFSDYMKFLKDYEDYRKMLEEIRWDLANDEL